MKRCTEAAMSAACGKTASGSRLNSCSRVSINRKTFPLNSAKLKLQVLCFNGNNCGFVKYANSLPFFASNSIACPPLIRLKGSPKFLSLSLLDILSNISPGASSIDCPNSKKSSIPLTTAMMQ